MMDSTSTNGLTTEQSPLPSRSSQSSSYTLSLQQQQALALQWLEQQQQQEQQQRHSLNQAILAAAAIRQHEQQQQTQNALLPVPNMVNSTSSLASSTSDVRNHQYFLEMELRRQIMLQQQLLVHTRDNLPSDNSKSLLQERLSQLLSTNASASQESNGVIPAATSGNSINIGTTDVDRIMAAETLLQRNRLQDAIRMLQIQGALQADSSVSRIGHSNPDTGSTAFPTSALLISNDPITPHTIGQAALTNSSISQLLQPGILTLGQLDSKVPRMAASADNLFQSTRNTSKRKADSSDRSSSTKETLSKKPKSDENRTEKLSSFPLPSLEKARRVTMTFKSFQDVWDELDAIPLQKEIFIRRLYKYDYKLVD